MEILLWILILIAGVIVAGLGVFYIILPVMADIDEWIFIAKQK